MASYYFYKYGFPGYRDERLPIDDPRKPREADPDVKALLEEALERAIAQGKKADRQRRKRTAPPLTSVPKKPKTVTVDEPLSETPTPTETPKHVPPFQFEDPTKPPKTTEPPLPTWPPWPKKAHKSYFTMGKYVGRFRRLKNKRRYDPFRSLGSTYKSETSGTSTGATVAEVGHSTNAAQQIVRSVGRSILRRCIEKDEQIITDWGDTPTGGSATYSVVLDYRADPTSAISSTTSYTFTAALSFEGMADELIAEFLKVVSNAATEQVWETIHFTSSSWTISVPLKEARVCYSVVSVLTVQNITESGESTGENHKADDIRANPLVGRCWSVRGNTFLPVAGSGSVGYSNNIALGTSGLVGDITGNLAHPKPPNFYQNAKRSGQVMLQPGQIKKSTLSEFKNIKFNVFMHLYKNWNKFNLSVSTSFDAYMTVGKSKLFHFEHMLDLTGTDPDVTVAYEINLFVKSYMKYYRKREALRIEA